VLRFPPLRQAAKRWLQIVEIRYDCVLLAKMKIILSFVALLMTVSMNAQVVDEKVQNELNSQKQAHVDTFLVYSLICNGGLIPLDTCAYEPTQYLFWTKNLKTYLKRFDYCKDYKPIQIDTLNPLSFYFANQILIGKEVIKQPTYYEVKKTKKGVDTILNSITVNHSCYHRFDFVLNGDTTTKVIDNFDLNYVKFDNGKKNIYYSYNQRTKQKKLIDIISKLIDILKHESKFETE